MIETTTNTICSLNNNDYAYITHANKINSLQPSINVLEFGESITNIAIFCIVMGIVFVLVQIKRKKLTLKKLNSFEFRFEFSVMALILIFIVGASFFYHKINLEKTNHEIVMLQEKMDELNKPGLDIVKLCTKDFTLLGSSAIKIVKNKDNEPSSYNITEK